MARPATGAHRASAKPAPAPRHAAHRSARPVAPARYAEPLAWPATFDDWMIDIVKRRALRLNSGARRRGVNGSVRAVDLAHILDRSADAQGRWLCDICHQAVTLNDLSFDHKVALADGGEHAAHNLVPAHRKCNEIKGSEKAQYRAQAVERWFTEQFATRSAATASTNAGRYAPPARSARPAARRYA